jgi:hypothetical protein
MDSLRFKTARQAENEAAPIRYVAELVGTDSDSEQAIRWLIALMVLCCDPLAIVLTAAASAQRSNQALFLHCRSHLSLPIAAMARHFCPAMFRAAL